MKKLIFIAMLATLIAGCRMSEMPSQLSYVYVKLGGKTTCLKAEHTVVDEIGKRVEIYLQGQLDGQYRQVILHGNDIIAVSSVPLDNLLTTEGMKK